MFKLGVVLVAVAAAFWLFAALLGGLFKLTFGFFGALFGSMLGMAALGMVALLVVPIVLFALLPLWMPVLLVIAVIWLIVRAGRADNVPAQPAQGEPRVG